MGNTRSGGWIGGTVVLAVAILLATWFLLAAPRLDAAAATLVEAKDTQARNEILAAQVATLRTDFARLDELKTELAGIAVQLPPQANLADLTHTVTQLALDNGVTLVGIVPGVSGVVTLPTPAVVEQPATDPAQTGGTAVDQAGATADDAAAAAEQQGEAEPADPAAPAAPAAPVAPVQIEGFVAYPVVVNVVGPYLNVLNFLDQLQNVPVRLFLVTDLGSTRLTTAEASQGRPATVDGDLDLMIGGYAYVLVDQPGTVAVTDGGDVADPEEPAEPVMPGSDRNPFVPLVPTG